MMLDIKTFIHCNFIWNLIHNLIVKNIDFLLDNKYSMQQMGVVKLVLI